MGSNRCSSRGGRGEPEEPASCSSGGYTGQFGTDSNRRCDNGRDRLDYLRAVRLGSFRLFPTLGVGVQYSDNIFATNGNKAGDAIFTVRPSLRLRSDQPGVYRLLFMRRAAAFFDRYLRTQ